MAGKHKLTKSRRPALRHIVQQEFGVVIQAGEHSSVRPSLHYMICVLILCVGCRCPRNDGNIPTAPEGLGEGHAFAT